MAKKFPYLMAAPSLFIEHLSKAGIQKQNAPKIYYNIQHNISFVDEDKKGGDGGVALSRLPH